MSKSVYPTAEMKELFTSIRAIRTDEEAANFFRDLLTPAELTEFANRWQMVKRLIAGQSYLEIAKALGTSTTTVARVAHWLHNGTGGYQTIAERILPKPKASEPPNRITSGKLRGFKNPRAL